MIGACSEASGLAVEVALQVLPQTARAIASATTIGLGLQMAVRLSRREVPHVPWRTGLQVTVGFALPIGPRAGVRVDSREPFGVTVETAPGTVPGTVPTMVTGRSVLTALIAPKATLFGYLCSSELAWPGKPPLQYGSTGLRAQEAADSCLRGRPPRLSILSRLSPTASVRPW